MTQPQSDGRELARYFRFFWQFRCHTPSACRHSLDKVPFLTFYRENAKKLDKLDEVLTKYNVNKQKYIKWFVLRSGKSTVAELIDGYTFVLFGEYLKKREQYFQIYTDFIKSANTVAEDCILNHQTSCFEYLKHLIVSNQLAAEYISGRISGYYIASIQNFKKIYFKLDTMNRDTLSTIYQVCDKMSEDVQEAFLMFKSMRIKLMSFTDNIISQKLN